MIEVFISKSPVVRIIKIPLQILVWFLCIPNFVKAGDTVFTSRPDTRNWNPQYMQEVFLEEFNGDRLDKNVWAVDLCKSRGYMGNNEGEPDNIEVSNGSLKLTVHHKPGNIDNNCWDNSQFISDYTTAEITTQWDRFKYGCFEAKCFFPRGDHFYYAYWLWGPGGEGYPSDGYISEIDIAEGTEWGDGTNHEMKTSVHYWSEKDGEIKLPKDWTFGYGTDFEGAWHVYKIIWNVYEMIYYVDDTEIWRRSKYYTDMDTTTNDVGMTEIIPGIPYHVREYFPNDEMQTTFQMHIQKNVPLSDLPVSMEVDYVKVSQYFLAPLIDCPKIIYSSDLVVLDVDSQATNISWHLEPASLFNKAHGSGMLAEIIPAPGMHGRAKITYWFNMPSGEKFSAAHDFLVDNKTSANRLLQQENDYSGSLLVSPNPAGNETTISFDGNYSFNAGWNIEIYTLSGQLKLKHDNLRTEDFKINLTGWEKGVYMVLAKNRNLSLTGKLAVTGSWK
ncbi:MAG TPA: family 16 glycosylhydrolase [Draconibacterium sp.]|nr:family 16 glycosylhydrolase [Draconibacterium sp.]